MTCVVFLEAATVAHYGELQGHERRLASEIGLLPPLVPGEGTPQQLRLGLMHETARIPPSGRRAVVNVCWDWAGWQRTKCLPIEEGRGQQHVPCESVGHA